VVAILSGLYLSPAVDPSNCEDTSRKGRRKSRFSPVLRLLEFYDVKDGSLKQRPSFEHRSNGGDSRLRLKLDSLLIVPIASGKVRVPPRGHNFASITENRQRYSN
jgi:hypothetical protein